MVAPPSPGVAPTETLGLLGDPLATYCERAGCDPKDGELCLIRLKSGETLMEDRSNSDVQIDCQSWA